MSQQHRTEAACLLEQGASYGRRIGLQPLAPNGDPIFAGFKRGAFSLYFGDAPIFHFDLEGRWQRAFIEGTHFLKGLDATVHAIDRVREGSNLVLRRRTLPLEETGPLDERIRSTAMELIGAINADSLARIEPATARAQAVEVADLRAFLERVASWDSAAWMRHRERYGQTYGPLPFLPPECQNAVMVQATISAATSGSFGFTSGCTTMVRSIAQFAEHIDNVAALWGRRLLQSRTLFLGDIDVLQQPLEQLIGYLDAIGQEFTIEPRTRGAGGSQVDNGDKASFDGVHAFLGNLSLPRPGPSAWRDLAARGLARVSIVVESGDPDVRALFRQSWLDVELRAAISDLKAAGIGVSLLTLVGAGGTRMSESHIEKTARLFDASQLGPGDFVFLLDEREILADGQHTMESNSLIGSTWSDQQARLKAALAPLKPKGVKVLPYTMEKQWT